MIEKCIACSNATETSDYPFICPACSWLNDLQSNEPQEEQLFMVKRFDKIAYVPIELAKFNTWSDLTKDEKDELLGFLEIFDCSEAAEQLIKNKLNLADCSRLTLIKGLRKIIMNEDWKWS